MAKVKWHWMKDHDYPKDGQDVWCLAKGFGEYISQQLTFSNDLYKVDKYIFSHYHKKHHKGFYNYDDGYYEVPGVICWTEIPDIPDELKEELGKVRMK